MSSSCLAQNAKVSIARTHSCIGFDGFGGFGTIRAAAGRASLRLLRLRGGGADEDEDGVGEEEDGVKTAADGECSRDELGEDTDEGREDEGGKLLLRFSLPLLRSALLERVFREDIAVRVNRIRTGQRCNVKLFEL